MIGAERELKNKPAGIGMALGFGYYFIAVAAAAYAVAISRIPNLLWTHGDGKKGYMSEIGREMVFGVQVGLPDFPDRAVISADDLALVDIEDGLDLLRAEAAADEIKGTPGKFRSGDVAEVREVLSSHRTPDHAVLDLSCPLPVARIMAAGVRLVAERLAADRARTGHFDPDQEKREKRFRAMGALFAAVDPPARVVEMVLKKHED